VLAARSGLLTKQQTLDALAAAAAVYDHRVGREWKPLEETTTDPVTAFRRPQAWRSFERSEDYYWEGLLVWLDVDTLIRERSGGRRSLDDFARAFFGIDDGSYVPVTYTFDEVVSALNGVEPYDWASFLRTRLDSLGEHAPLDGFTRGGYSLVYTDTPSEYFRTSEIRRGITDLSYSLGFVTTTADGRLTEVLWNSPAFGAGLTVGTQIISVNGASYDANRLRAAIAAAGQGAAPVELVVRADDRVRTVKFDYAGGLKYPHLQRQAGTPARLDDILTPRPV
jgi:predicted metalloprotease with PDZ domain